MWTSCLKTANTKLITRQTRVYKVLSSKGPANNPTFEVGVYLDDESILLGVGVGSSKKEAEKMAAKEALSKLAIKGE